MGCLFASDIGNTPYHFQEKSEKSRIIIIMHREHSILWKPFEKKYAIGACTF